MQHLPKKLFSVADGVTLYEGPCGYDIQLDDQYILHVCKSELENAPIILVIEALIVLGNFYMEAALIDEAQLLDLFKALIQRKNRSVTTH